MNINESINKLKDGNERYVKGTLLRPNQTLEHIESVSKEQSPFVLILTCNDSRVMPNLIFDLGIGDASIVRIGGNIVNEHILGTMEYVLEHLGTQLIVVLGHTNCGAVKMAATTDQARAHIQTLIDEIKPAVNLAKGIEGDLVENAIEVNAKITVEKIKNSKPFINMLVEQGQVTVIGAIYDMETGVVRFLQ